MLVSRACLFKWVFEGHIIFFYRVDATEAVALWVAETAVGLMEAVAEAADPDYINKAVI